MCVYAKVQTNEINFQTKYFIEVTSTYGIQKNNYIGQGPTDQFFHQTDIRQDQNLGPMRFSEKEFQTDAFKSACDWLTISKSQSDWLGGHLASINLKIILRPTEDALAAIKQRDLYQTIIF